MFLSSKDFRLMREELRSDGCCQLLAASAGDFGAGYFACKTDNGNQYVRDSESATDVLLFSLSLFLALSRSLSLFLGACFLFLHTANSLDIIYNVVLTLFSLTPFSN